MQQQDYDKIKRIIAIYDDFHAELAVLKKRHADILAEASRAQDEEELAKIRERLSKSF